MAYMACVGAGSLAKQCLTAHSHNTCTCRGVRACVTHGRAQYPCHVPGACGTCVAGASLTALPSLHSLMMLWQTEMRSQTRVPAAVARHVWGPAAFHNSAPVGSLV